MTALTRGGRPAVTRHRAAVLAVVCGAGVLAAWLAWPAPDRGMVYAAPGGTPLTLEIDYPAGPGPHPVVLFAPHRGDWDGSFKREDRCRILVKALTRAGYAVATIHYRLIGEHRFPAQIQDGKAAVRWLRANAGRLRLAADRVGAIGVSAGGYGVCMLGTTGPGDGFDDLGEDPAAGRVQAVVALGAPVDWTGGEWSAFVEAHYLRPFLGKTFAEDPALYARASPGAYATSDDPPVLLVHSAHDQLVPVAQARAFAAKLRRAGVTVELVEEAGADHVWGGPRLENTLTSVVKFLDANLRR
ncbi:alpha/beta hydrolase [Gemmata sp. JC717]|uniref:alpha/beta hydrolase fold domain-containing protein n=1 Tax=Gemmata algarum TaxID=2975278 RepID=UPI0021BBB399|nr:alpha/beta hydrolase [Gemmata algarum]MDY3554436.1 alpha/beta hydrolase [Gemmata algarum]